MTYPEILRYLESFIDYERQNSYDYNKSFKIDRMRKIAALLGDPQSSINSIHIAGSKGKGSTAAITYSILKAAGFKTGLYTSPHLTSFCERIRINDELISEEDIGRLMDKIKDVVDGLKDDSISFFEVYTALAYLYFSEKKVDFAVYEVGLGGRLDATNVITPLVCAITPISYEHTQKLGSTLREIASEKAGIVKENAICVMSPQEKEAETVIMDICKKKNAKIIRVGKDIKYRELSSDAEKEIFSVSGLSEDYPRLEMKLLGPHQVVNAATAIGIIEALKLRGVAVPEEAVRKGAASARWDGRLEVIAKRPYMILDGAQNSASAKALAKAVKDIFFYKKLILVLGVSKDKDIKGILKELVSISDSIILTKSKVVDRALEPAKMKELINDKNKKIILTSGVEEAIAKAGELAAPEDLILITGSLFVVGEAKICRELISTTP